MRDYYKKTVKFNILQIILIVNLSLTCNTRLHSQSIKEDSVMVELGQNYVFSFYVDSFILHERLFCHSEFIDGLPKKYQSRYANFYSITLDSVFLQLNDEVYEEGKMPKRIYIAVNPRLYQLQSGKIYRGLFTDGICDQYVVLDTLVEQSNTFFLSKDFKYLTARRNSFCCKKVGYRKFYRPMVCDLKVDEIPRKRRIPKK
jgi:hypothetical protein